LFVSFTSVTVSTDGSSVESEVRFYCIQRIEWLIKFVCNAIHYFHNTVTDISSEES